MKILIFAAAVSVAQSQFVTRIVSDFREAGHTAGERSLPAFRLEKEPADALVVLLSQDQASAHKERLLELVQVFGEDVIKGVEIPNDDKELEDFDVQSLIERFNDESTAGFLTLEQAKAEAIERGLEVRADTTRAELEHMLGVDIHPGPQAGDRKTDQVNNAANPEQRIGVRTSQLTPTVGGIALERQNDEQLKATAAQMGIETPSGMRRETIIAKIEAKVRDGAGFPPADDKDDEDGDGLEARDMTLDKLNDIVRDEQIDLNGATKKADIVKAIRKAREEKANG